LLILIPSSIRIVRRKSIAAVAVIALIIAASGLCLTAQDALRRDVLTTWTTEQGLPQNFIRAIEQTSDGFLWVGTMNGLARFDGIRFRIFSVDAPAELQGSITGLARDGSGGLWVATAHGLFHYRGQRFDLIPVLGNVHSRIDGLTGGVDGEVWIYANGRLSRSHGNTVEARDLPAGAGAVRDLTGSRDGALWIADGANVYEVRGNAAAVRYALPGARVLYADDFGEVYAGDGHGLFRFDGRGFAKVPDPGLGNFVGVMVDHEHRLWLASGGLHGISRKAGDAKETLTAADGLASDDVRQIFEDRNHDIWLGTISGLQRLHRGVFTTFTAKDGLGGEVHQLDTVFQQKSGAIWVGTLGGGVVELDGERWRRYGRTDGLPPGQVRGFVENGSMPAIAISDYGMFAHESASKGKTFGKLPWSPMDYINTPVRTGDGSIWYSLAHHGMFRLLGKDLKHIDVGDGTKDDGTWSVTVDANGSLWVSTANELMRWNGERFEGEIPTPEPAICAAWLHSGGVALGMLNGLLLKTPGGTRTLTQPAGLPGSSVMDVLEDGKGDLWLATTRAIARLPREQWTAYANGKVDHVDPIVYSTADGLKADAVLPLNEVTAIRSQDGRIWFATANGLSVAGPQSVKEPPVTAVIDSIVVDDRERLAGDLEVAPGQHRITFVYTTPPTVAPEQIRFRYRLIGWDKYWIDAGTAREVSYTALRPGSYQFEVKAINREGASTATSAMVTMRIRPYFWQTTWFVILTICAVAAILVEITRRRTRVSAERLSLRFQERVAERERIAYQIHDTVIQDMIGAALQLELLGFQIADQPARAEGLLDQLAERMRETIARSRNMVWSLHSTAVVQYSLVEVLRHAEAEFRLGPLPEFALTSVGEARHVHPLVRDEVYRICREALANAFRHSNAKRVEVTVEFMPDGVGVEIRDDGDGMDEETRTHGRPGHFGLPGMQAHARRIGAQILIESEPGKGTRVVLRVRTQESLWHRWRIWLTGIGNRGSESDGSESSGSNKVGNE